MTYKMIVLDMDDTLLQDDHSISEENAAALMKAQEKGVKVVLASGRPTFGMWDAANELRLADYGSYILSYNGANIFNAKTKELLFESTLSPETVHHLYDLSRRENVGIQTYVNEAILTPEDNEFTQIESTLTGLPVALTDDFKQAVKEPVVKVLMLKEGSVLEKVEQKLKEELAGTLSVYRSKPYFLEFTEHGVTKGTSLEQLAKKLEIDRSEIIAVGDSYNDLEMIKFAGLGVAMDNAPDDIKEAADFVTRSNMEHGVAHVVEKYLL
ncbi:Cof-type HAD-IIB family hydrolase [Jeotgalibacillus haloalkalitolerans]|uniref:Cof-type HAD-IIB family hydrolase n=1 Tax=Jeotgalibacillus haloalkalitolerans TaxID=3104292 RepID=A0ABU5KJ67_9BACL|nr:Cof-type HAD-IIB family hydrolase [Jeotgalibacillus sp. HH7-29]MDZ5710966.1 Cof-type HAD-IIB family hydrolase [Jeotgalibacillus sp. HH7-29]